MKIFFSNYSEVQAMSNQLSEVPCRTGMHLLPGNLLLNKSLIAFVFIQFVIISNCFSQLVVEAGKDTAVCADSPTTLMIGGNPTVTGGAAPYRYIWHGSYQYAGHIYTASFMLEDTAIANPVFKDGAIPDSVLLFVTVRDEDNNTSIDSIEIRQSRYTSCLGECRYDIYEGDSIQLGHCITGGLPPLQFQWEPMVSLSDELLEDPWAKPTSSTTYILQISDSIGCQTESNCKVYVIPVGIDTKNKIQVLEVNFNPSEKIIYLKSIRDCVPNSSFELINLSGSTILKVNVEADMLSINLQHLKQGLYVYHWTSGGKKIASGKILL